MGRTLRSIKQTGLIGGLCILFGYGANAQYCKPTYSITQCTSYNMYIDDVTTSGGKTNIKNLNSTCGNASTSFTYYSSHVHEGVQGTNVGFSVTIGSSYSQGVKIWVDFNIDGDYTDAGELVYSSSSTIGAGKSATGSFTIPANAVPGDSRMRIRSVYGTTSFTDCNTQNYGECEDYKFVIVPSCPVDFAVHPVAISECQNSSTTFTASAKNADSYRWQVHTGSGGFADLNNAGPYSGVSTDSMTITGLTMKMSGYRFKVFGYNQAENCEVESDEAILTVIPSGYPSINISATDEEICEGQEVSIYSVFTKGGTSPQYQWKINGVDTPGMNAATYKASDIKDGDEISVVFTSTEVCIFPKESNKITFKVHKLVDPAVNVQVSYKGENTYMFTAQPTNGGANPHYQWYKNGNKLSGETGASYTATGIKSTDRVYVEMVSDEECVSEKIVSSRIYTTGMADINDHVADIGLYPNPNSGNFLIKGRFDIPVTGEQVQVNITNSLGQTVYTTTVPANGNEISIPVNMDAKAANGVYMANISIGERTSHIRFMLNR